MGPIKLFLNFHWWHGSDMTRRLAWHPMDNVSMMPLIFERLGFGSMGLTIAQTIGTLETRDTWYLYDLHGEVKFNLVLDSISYTLSSSDQFQYEWNCILDGDGLLELKEESMQGSMESLRTCVHAFVCVCVKHHLVLGKSFSNMTNKTLFYLSFWKLPQSYVLCSRTKHKVSGPNLLT